MTSTSKDRVLLAIRKALATKLPAKLEVTDFESSVYNRVFDNEFEEFAFKFTEQAGIFHFCESPENLANELELLFEKFQIEDIVCFHPLVASIFNVMNTPYRTDGALETADTIITGCECLVAMTGAVVVSSKQFKGRTSTIIPPIHIVIAELSEVVADIKEALTLIKAKYNTLPSMVSHISGPSRTADIEKTLVRGAHGPKELIVILVDTRQDEE